MLGFEEEGLQKSKNEEDLELEDEQENQISQNALYEQTMHSSTIKVEEDYELDDLDEGLETKTKEDRKKEEVYFDHIECQESYFIFDQDMLFRKVVYKIVTAKIFDNIILFLIVLSSIKLILETYLPDNDTEYQNVRKISEYFDLAFTLIFTMEFALKSISSGFVMDKHSYLRDN